MLMAGAFKGMPAANETPELLYVHTSGGRERRCKPRPLKPPRGDERTVDDIVAEHAARFEGIVARFAAGEAAYVSRPFPKYARAFCEYDHLARVKEWSLGERGRRLRAPNDATISSSPTITPRRRQRRAADPRASAWVSANAGAGKTKVLTDRVVRLLLAGRRPARILCLTFTKAAAANMAIRVFERLARWVTLDDAALARELAGAQGERPRAPQLRPRAASSPARSRRRAA